MMRYYKKIFSGIRQDRPKFGSDRVNKLSEDESRGLENMFSEEKKGKRRWRVDVTRHQVQKALIFGFSNDFGMSLRLMLSGRCIGVRQGDPLSPFLFIISVEGLNVMVKEAVEKGVFNGVKVEREDIMISHLQYVDDTIFFGEWSRYNSMNLMCILKVEDMARRMRCSAGELPITYLCLPIGICMRRESAWRPVACENMRASEGGRGVWLDIMRVGSDINKLGIEFSSSFVRKVRNGAHISFWRDSWIDGGRLMDRFHRLFHLDIHKYGVVADKGNWVEGMWRWVWDSTRAPRGRVVGELEALEACVGYTNLLLNHKDSWKWLLADNDIFSVKALTKLIGEKCIDVGNNISETIWNKLVSKKVNIFMWRVGRGRLPVRV
ncbi:hypothetical protein Tco_0206573 [Tanacetum coccineum]